MGKLEYTEMDFAFLFRLILLSLHACKKHSSHFIRISHCMGLTKCRILTLRQEKQPQELEGFPSLGEDNLEITSDGLVFHWVNFQITCYN